IDGEWTELSTESIPILSPATGKQIASVPRGTREDVARAVQAARAAQPAFAALTVFERSKLCHQIGDIVQARREDLGRFLSMEQGKPYHAEALGEVDVAAKMFRMAAEDATRLEGSTIASDDPRKRLITIRQPRGVYGVITPWNFPLAIPTEY